MKIALNKLFPLEPEQFDLAVPTQQPWDHLQYCLKFSVKNKTDVDKASKIIQERRAQLEEYHYIPEYDSCDTRSDFYNDLIVSQHCNYKYLNYDIENLLCHFHFI